MIGFDILLDSKLTPWLIEVNSSPSFSTDSPFDLQLKKQLIMDTLGLLNVMSNRNKIKYFR
jgi:hypothetical protein